MCLQGVTRVRRIERPQESNIVPIGQVLRFSLPFFFLFVVTIGVLEEHIICHVVLIVSIISHVRSVDTRVQHNSLFIYLCP